LLISPRFRDFQFVDSEVKDGTVKMAGATDLTGQAVRHPPRSGWLSERGRLKGGCPGGFVVALKRASVL